MVERTAETVSSRQLEVAGTAEEHRKVHSVRGHTQPDALISDAAAAEHREVRRGCAGADHVFRVALCKARVHLDVVARTGRDVLDLQRSHHRSAPLGFGVAGDFRQSGRSRSGSGQDVIRAVDFMPFGRNLEQTPGLIDADVTDDIGSMNTSIRVAGDAGPREAGRQVVNRGAVEHGRIIEADAAGHAVAKLGGVLDVVHAGDGVFAAEQERAVVARITIPGRRVGRRRLTEGEAGELQEHVFDRDIAAADGIKQLGVVAEVGGEDVRVERV